MESNLINDIWKPDVFILGPGGAKGFLELGLMLKFEQDNYLDDTKIFVGCSIGSCIALLIVAGYRASEIINDYIDFNLLTGADDINDINLDNLKEKPGILSGNKIENILNQKIKDKFGYVPNLDQFYLETGIISYFVTYNVDKREIVRLSKDNEPTLSCVEATLMSMAMPGLLCPRIYKGDAYVDGAIGDPYPILFLDDGDKKILGVSIDSDKTTSSTDRNPIKYLFNCAQASMDALRDMAVKYSSDKCKHISLKTSVIDTTGISISVESRRKMIETGYKTASIFLMRLKNPEKYKVVLDDEEIPFVDDIYDIYDIDNNHGIDDETQELLNLILDNSNKNSEEEDLFI